MDLGFGVLRGLHVGLPNTNVRTCSGAGSQAALALLTAQQDMHIAYEAPDNIQQVTPLHVPWAKQVCSG